jgi:hypothetical protein
MAAPFGGLRSEASWAWAREESAIMLAIASGNRDNNSQDGSRFMIANGSRAAT